MVLLPHDLETSYLEKKNDCCACMYAYMGVHVCACIHMHARTYMHVCIHISFMAKVDSI